MCVCVCVHVCMYVCMDVCLCLCVYVSRLFGNVRDLDKLNTTGGTISKNEIQNEKCNANGFMEEIIKRPPRTSRVDSQVSR